MAVIHIEQVLNQEVATQIACYANNDESKYRKAIISKCNTYLRKRFKCTQAEISQITLYVGSSTYAEVVAEFKKIAKKILKVE